MYKLFIDANETFEATIHTNGMDSNAKSKCRLVVENSKFNILFEGKVENGKCIIPIKKLKEVLQEGDTGTLRLEVIADDVFFTPWHQEFTAHVSKKLTVEVKSSTTISKPTLTAKVTTKQSNSVNALLITELNSLFKKYNINLTNVGDKRKHIKLITETVLKSKKFNKLQLSDNQKIDVVISALSKNNN